MIYRERVSTRRLRPENGPTTTARPDLARQFRPQLRLLRLIGQRFFPSGSALRTRAWAVIRMDAVIGGQAIDQSRAKLRNWPDKPWIKTIVRTCAAIHIVKIDAADRMICRHVVCKLSIPKPGDLIQKA